MRWNMSGKSARFAAGFVAALLLGSCGGDDPVVPGVPVAMQIVHGEGQHGTVGQELPEALVVLVTDDNDVPVPGQLVNFRVTAGGGSVFAGAAITNDSGLAQERWTLGTSTAAAQTLEARAVDAGTGAPIVFATFTAIPDAGPPATMTRVGADSGSAVAGQPVDVPPAVELRDQYGNVVPGRSVAFAVTSGGGTIAGSPATSNASGVAAATTWTLGAALGPNTATATVTGVPAVVFHAEATTSASGLVFSQVAAGNALACALAAGGVAYCWGGSNGGVGDGTGQLRKTVTPVSGGLAFTSVSASLVNNACGLVAGGTGYCWGQNTSTGSLGTGDTLPGLVPKVLAGGLSYARVEAGCGLTVAGASYCWGLAPVLTNAGPFTEVAADYVQCGLNGSGIATCWRGAPTPVQGAITFASITTGFNQACGLTAAGAAYCWGNNINGEFGNDTISAPNSNVSALSPVSGGLTFTSLSGGNGFTCGIATGGAAYCWGQNPDGQLGTGNTTPQHHPVPVSGGLSFVKMSAGTQFACALTGAGRIYCWGHNGAGQLGDGTTTNRLVPTALR